MIYYFFKISECVKKNQFKGRIIKLAIHGIAEKISQNNYSRNLHEFSVLANWIVWLLRLFDILHDAVVMLEVPEKILQDYDKILIEF